MPRKTLRNYAHGLPVTPNDIGPLMVDSEGDEITVPGEDALRVSLSPESHGPAEEIIEELRRIRVASELILGQEVEPMT